MVSPLIDKGYAQLQEFNADYTAVTLLADSGYSPRGLIEILGELEKKQKPQSAGFNRTHPTPVQRLRACLISLQVPCQLL